MPQYQENDPFKGLKNEINNTKDSTGEFDPNDINQNKGVSSLAYLGILFWIPLVARPKSPFAKFHSNQGLILFIVMAVLNILKCVIGFIPVVNTLVSACVSLIGLAYFLYGLINTLNGKAKELPIIGKMRLIN